MQRDRHAPPNVNFDMNMAIQHPQSHECMTALSNAMLHRALHVTLIIPQTEISMTQYRLSRACRFQHTKMTEIHTNHQSFSWKAEEMSAGALKGSTTMQAGYRCPAGDPHCPATRQQVGTGRAKARKQPEKTRRDEATHSWAAAQPSRRRAAGARRRRRRARLRRPPLRAR